MRNSPEARRKRGLLIFGIWTLVALVAASQIYLLRLSAGRPPEWGSLLIGSFWGCWLWAAFTPAIIALARRFPFERKQWGRNLVAHITAAIGFTVLDVLLTELVSRWIPMGPPRPLLGAFFSQSFLDILSYFAVVAIAYAVDYRAALAERTMAAARLEAQLLSAQLRSLEMQIRPHFLFNTLHTIASLVRSGANSAAVEMVAGLSDLLRVSLRREDGPEIRLRDELALVERYLEIEGIRFQDRLRTSIVASPDVLDALVPTLILQPLVENAIRHGIESHMAPGWVEVEARRHNGSLLLRVQDSSGESSHQQPRREGSGIGISNTQARLRHLYGESQRFTLAGSPDGGTTAVVEIPFHREPFIRSCPCPQRLSPFGRSSWTTSRWRAPASGSFWRPIRRWRSSPSAGAVERRRRRYGRPLPDIVFLDVQMPEVDGFEVVRRIGPDASPTIVFVTAYDAYAVRAFEAEALDYLLKPFDDARFYRTLARAKERVRERRAQLAHPRARLGSRVGHFLSGSIDGAGVPRTSSAPRRWKRVFSSG